MAVVATENPLRFNPHYKLRIDSSGRYKMVYHNDGKDSTDFSLDLNLDKRAVVHKKVNHEQM